jgi:hypothetical protein
MALVSCPSLKEIGKKRYSVANQIDEKQTFYAFKAGFYSPF